MHKEDVFSEEFKFYLESHSLWKTLKNEMQTSPMDSEHYDADDTERAAQLAKMLDLPLLGNGSNRFVVEYKGMAVKLPLWSMGRGENTQEATIWESCSESVRPYFLPCLGCDDFFSIYPLVETFAYDDWPAVIVNFENYYKQMVFDLHEDGIHLDDAGFYEERYDQWSFFEGRLVLIDYGACFIVEASRR